MCSKIYLYLYRVEIEGLLFPVGKELTVSNHSGHVLNEMICLTEVEGFCL